MNKMSNKSTTTTYILTLALLSACVIAQSPTTLTGQCLVESIRDLVKQGCHFSAKTEIVNLLRSQGNSSQNFNFGQSTYEQAQAIWPKPAFLATYFKSAIAEPMTPLRGELGAGIQYFGDYVVVSMDNIHLCSDQGKYADYSMTSSKLIVKKSIITNYSKDDIRLAGWQLACENKARTYSDLLKGIKLTHSTIAME